MTAVEFYDRTPVENVISALTTRPDKIIFIGENRQMRDFHTVYAAFLQRRHLDIQVEYRGINRHDISGIAQVLKDIVQQEEECLFDLTGGDDLTLVAMGMVYQQYKDTHCIYMQRCNVYNGRVTDCDNDGNTVYTGTPNLTVEELVAIHGGAVRYGGVADGYTYRWMLTDEFTDDVAALWNICRENPNLWNICLTALGNEGPQNGHTPMVTSSLARVEGYLAGLSVPITDLHRLMHRIQSAGIIKDYRAQEGTISFCCKDMQIKRCLDKAGTVLEMKVLTAARRLMDKDGAPYYTDAMGGVYIDWDGEMHARTDREKDTGNEMDVVLMKGLAPVFISCKNGAVYDEELYKLSTVTARFGSRYAKKVLITSHLNKKGDSLLHFRQRTEDMGIRLVEDVHLLGDAAFDDMMKKLIMSR